MSLPHAILGILQHQSVTGYDLKTQFFDKSIAHFWSADQAQIYRTLDKLTEEGWVESQLEIQADRPNRKVYSITPMGEAELRRWLTTDQALVTPRQPFLVQLFFAAGLPKQAVLDLLEVQLVAHEERLAQYREIPVPPLDDLALTREEFFQRLPLELGLQSETTYIAWLRQTIAWVQNRITE